MLFFFPSIKFLISTACFFPFSNCHGRSSLQNQINLLHDAFDIYIEKYVYVYVYIYAVKNIILDLCCLKYGIGNRFGVL